MQKSVVLDNQKLLSLCERIRDNSAKYSVPMSVIIDVLFVTGLRINEIIELDRWEIMNSNTVKVKVQKSNNYRFFATSEINELFLAWINNIDFLERSFLSSGQVNRYVLQNIGYRYIKNETKEITTYLFRYNYARQLKDSGIDDAVISQMMGHTQLTSTQHYLTDTLIAYL